MNTASCLFRWKHQTRRGQVILTVAYPVSGGCRTGLTRRPKLLHAKPRSAEPMAPLRLSGNCRNRPSACFGSGPLMSLRHLPTHTQAGTQTSVHASRRTHTTPSSLTSSFSARSRPRVQPASLQWPRRCRCERYSVPSIRARTPRTAFLHRRSSLSPRWGLR